MYLNIFLGKLYNQSNILNLNNLREVRRSKRQKQAKNLLLKLVTLKLMLLVKLVKMLRALLLKFLLLAKNLQNLLRKILLKLPLHPQRNQKGRVNVKIHLQRRRNHPVRNLRNLSCFFKFNLLLISDLKYPMLQNGKI